jgi:hypothetical protein
MASMKEAATLTSELEELAGRMRAELADGDVDFARMAQYADELGGGADRLAETFSAMNEALDRRLQGNGKRK